MKHRFDKPTPERLKEFKDAINAETRLFCNVKDAYDDDKALAFLEQLTMNWKMSTDRVIAKMVSSVYSGLDKRLRYYVLQFADAVGIKYDKDKIMQRWDTLTDAEKNEIADGVINYMDEHQRPATEKGTE